MQAVQLAPVATNSYAWNKNFSPGTGVGTAGVSVKTSQGRVRRLSVTNTGAAIIFGGVFDKASAPIAGDAPVDRISVPVNGTAVLDFGPEGLYLATGIGVAFSTTAGTVTLLAGATAFYCIEYL